MKNQKTDVCPGCSRHCTRDNPRCKRGRAYFAQLQDGEPRATAVRKGSGKKRRWEKHVTEGGIAWQLIYVGRRAKKALRREEISEAQFINALDEQERDQLAQLLKKLDASLK